MPEKSYKLKESDRKYIIDNHVEHKTLIANIGESAAIKKELEDGKYIIFQLGQGHEIPFPVFAFKVDYGNFKIVSVFGSKDISNLAAQIWDSRFKNGKARKTIKLINELRKDLDRIEKEMLVEISRNPHYAKKEKT